MNTQLKWDVFLSHATEDKEAFVRPLAERLVKEKIKTWYDEFEVQLGDSIRESIDNGLRLSRFAIIVLSRNYFQKSWTTNELNGYFSADNGEAKRILPIWYNVTKDDVYNYSPILADRVAADANSGIDTIVDKVKRRLNINFSKKTEHQYQTTPILSQPINWSSLTEYTHFRFGQLGIDEFWQAALLEDIGGINSFKTISDIDDALVKSSIAVAVLARNSPSLFDTGTDYITKSLGFVDLQFRSLHNFSFHTLTAFEKYKSLIRQ